MSFLLYYFVLVLTHGYGRNSQANLKTTGLDTEVEAQKGRSSENMAVSNESLPFRAAESNNDLRPVPQELLKTISSIGNDLRKAGRATPHTYQRIFSLHKEMHSDHLLAQEGPSVPNPEKRGRKEDRILLNAFHNFELAANRHEMERYNIYLREILYCLIVHYPGYQAKQPERFACKWSG